MFSSDSSLTRRVSSSAALLRQALRRLTIFDFVVVGGLSCLLPLNLFSFLYVSDLLLLFFAFVIIPYGISHRYGFYLGKEQILVALYAAWAYFTYARNPLHEGFFIGWSMYVMPAILFISLSQLVYCRENKDGLEKGWIIWGLFVAGQLIIALGGSGNGITGFELHYTANIYWARSNYIAAILEIPVLWTYHVMQQKRPESRFAMFAFVLCVVALLLTVSRGGILTILLCLLVYSLLRRKYIFLLFAGMVVGIMLPQFSSRFSDMLDSSNLDRMYLWVQAADLFLKSPIVGNGPGDILLYSTFFTIAEFMTDPHNFILTILVHTGIVGFAIFTAMMAVFFRRALWINKKQKNPFYIVALCSAFFHGMVEPTFIGYAYSFIFWFCMAALTVQAHQLGYQAEKRARKAQRAAAKRLPRPVTAQY
jgi:O-antigen ligase